MFLKFVTVILTVVTWLPS